jgi:hypothetical protein
MDHELEREYVNQSINSKGGEENSVTKAPLNIHPPREKGNPLMDDTVLLVPVVYGSFFEQPIVTASNINNRRRHYLASPSNKI